MCTFPAFEAPPIVLAAARMVGKPKAIGPPLLLGAPTAVPDELVNASFACGVHLDRSDKVGAPGSSAQRDPLDPKVWLGGEHVGEQAPDLD
jgi:hypothetical protein